MGNDCWYRVTEQQNAVLTMFGNVIRTDTVELLPTVSEFGILTITEGEMELRFNGVSMKMKAGETCLIPRNAPALALVGHGAAALAMPNNN